MRIQSCVVLALILIRNNYSDTITCLTVNELYDIYTVSDSLINEEVCVIGSLVYLPINYVESWPEPLKCFYFLQGEETSPGNSPNMRLYSDTIDFKNNPMANEDIGPYLNKNVKVIGNWRQLTVISIIGAANDSSKIPYLEMHSIDSISSAGINNENFYPLKKNDFLKINNDKIQFLISNPSVVTIEIYNVEGRILKKIVNDIYTEGWHTVTLDEIRNNAEGISGGAYFLRLKINGKSMLTEKILLLQ